MLRGLILPILFLCVACEQGRPITKPALELTGRVVDEADILTDAEERLLTAKLAALEAHEGPQLVVATTRSLNGENINSYSVNLARAWGLGSKNRNDGILLLVAPNERRVRVEVGRGLEKRLPDTLCKHIIDEQIVPRFQKEDMAGGIGAGVDALIGEFQSLPRQNKAHAA